MAATAPPQYSGGLKCPPLYSSPFFNRPTSRPRKTVAFSSSAAVAAAVAISNSQTRERQQLKELFQEARDRCLSEHFDGISFTEEEFLAALDKYELNTDIGAKIRGTIYKTDVNGAFVDITAKSPAFLPVKEACIYNIKHVAEAGICLSFQDEFLVIGQNVADDSLVLSLRAIQFDLAWERCRQLQAEDSVVMGKVTGGNKGGVIAIVECLRGFVPFSQIFMVSSYLARAIQGHFYYLSGADPSKSTTEELLNKELPLKFVEVNEEQCRLILSHRKAITDTRSRLEIGSVVIGTVQSLKPYGAFIDIGGINGLLHVSQISHDRVSDVATVLQPGDTLKAMILSYDREKGRVSLSTKKLEPTPGDMIRNPKLVFEKADEMAQTFRQRIAQAEAMAHADMLTFQPESRLSFSSEGILGPLKCCSPHVVLYVSNSPPALDT